MNFDVSIGVFVSNEEALVRKSILSILTQKKLREYVKEILVFSSGSKDKTNEILRRIKNDLKEKEFDFKLYFLRERKGKFYDINRFLRIAKGDILIISSGDIVWEKNTLINLLEPFNNPSIGIVASHPIPKIFFKDISPFLWKIVYLQWELHHYISKHHVKFGELIAFRKVINMIPQTSVDEEAISYLVLSKGYLPFYAEHAIVYNFGPNSFFDFINQRRRIFCGHIELLFRYGYSVPSLFSLIILRGFFRLFSFKELLIFTLWIFLEIYSRVLGFFDFIFNRRKHYIWVKIRK